MSSILQRLVMGARDPAVRGGARIEPVLAVRYSPSALSEPTQESVSTAPRSPDSPVRSMAQVTSPVHTAANATLAQALPISPASTKQTAVFNNGFENTGRRSHREPTQQLADVTIHPIRHKPVTDERASAEESSTPSHEPADAKTVVVPAIAPISITPLLPESAPFTERRAMPVAPMPARTDRTHAAEPPAVNIAQATQEITISIGHIEIRGARAPTVAKRAEFRPRVSLSDFLNREGRR